jgi:hypothetical protein
MQITTPTAAALAATPSIGPSRARRTAWPAVEIAQRQRDDWARAFAARLVWLGALDGAPELARLGRAFHEHYGLLDPYHIARMVWRRRPKGASVVVPAARP